MSKENLITDSEKLEFISSDINNIIQLKRDTENNINTVTRYYAL